jgi:hypothetical protein
LTDKVFGLRKATSTNNEGSKGDSEICVLGIESYLLDSGFSYITGERFLYIPYAIIYIFSGTLPYHFDSTVRQVANKTCQLMAIGYVVSREAKADALHTPDEDYMFGSLVHFRLTIGKDALFLSPMLWFHVNLKRLLTQVVKYVTHMLIDQGKKFYAG